MLKRNEGNMDRILRVVAGLALLGWYFFAGGPIWALIGIVPLATGALGSCPVYSIFGINTCKLKNNAQ
ncbi:YgaP family membrane protein [Aliiroseovarius sp. S253]|uniref:YgaP family membrane protein n=1 Tax=Aliiroseovarius sp. S253 TaxID=3415133 RepID=UPI003C7B0DBA